MPSIGQDETFSNLEFYPCLISKNMLEILLQTASNSHRIIGFLKPQSVGWPGRRKNLYYQTCFKKHFGSHVLQYSAWGSLAVAETEGTGPTFFDQYLFLSPCILDSVTSVLWFPLSFGKTTFFSSLEKWKIWVPEYSAFKFGRKYLRDRKDPRMTAMLIFFPGSSKFVF